MVGARGCIIYDATTELTSTPGAVLPGSGIYTISVARGANRPARVSTQS